LNSPKIPFFGGATGPSEPASDGVKNPRGGKARGSEFATFLAQAPTDKPGASRDGRPVKIPPAGQSPGRQRENGTGADPAKVAASLASAQLESAGQEEEALAEAALHEQAERGQPQRFAAGSRDARPAVAPVKPAKFDENAAAQSLAAPQGQAPAATETHASPVATGPASTSPATTTPATGAPGATPPMSGAKPATTGKAPSEMLRPQSAQSRAAGTSPGRAAPAAPASALPAPGPTTNVAARPPAEPARSAPVAAAPAKVAAGGDSTLLAEAAAAASAAAGPAPATDEGAARAKIANLPASRASKQSRAGETTMDARPLVGERSEPAPAPNRAAPSDQGSSTGAKIVQADTTAPLAGPRSLRSRQTVEQSSAQQQNQSTDRESAAETAAAEEAPRSRKAARQEAVSPAAVPTEAPFVLQATAPVATTPTGTGGISAEAGRPGRLNTRHPGGAASGEAGDDRFQGLPVRAEGKSVSGAAPVGFMAQAELPGALPRLDLQALAAHRPARLVDAAFAAGVIMSAEGNGAEPRRISKHDLELGVALPAPTLPLDFLLNAPLNGGAPEMTAASMLPPAAAPILEHVAQDPNLSVTVMSQTAHMTIAGDDGRALELHLRMLPEGGADIRAAGALAPMMQSRVHELGQALAAQGFTLGSFEMNRGDSRESTYREPDDEPGEGGGSGTGVSKKTSDSSSTGSRGSGRIHVKA
jgi:hypothetical protein